MYYDVNIDDFYFQYEKSNTFFRKGKYNNNIKGYLRK